MSIHMSCALCSASVNGDNVDEVIEWSETHAVHCPGKSEVS